MESYEKDTMIQNENGKLITSVLQFIITFVWESRYSMFFLQTCVSMGSRILRQRE